VYHLELRQFPHNVCRFNLSEQELGAVVEPWAREQWVELGERKWSPHQARLTILEGPRIPVHQLSMGRGWRNAQRQCEDVSDRVLAAAKKRHDSLPPDSARGDTSSPEQADSLALELLPLLEHAPVTLSRAWALARSRFPDRPASECLALAEQAVRSLLRRRLVVLLGSPPHPAHGSGAAGDVDAVVGEGEIEPLLAALESWSGEGEPGAVSVRRA
jgi:hypothetical protein